MQMKATEQYLPVEYLYRSLALSVTIQMKEEYFPVLPFIVLYQVVPTFESMDEIVILNLFRTTLSSSFVGHFWRKT